MSRQQNPFVDPTDPFRDSNRYGPSGSLAAAAAGSQSDLMAGNRPMSSASTASLPVSITNPYARYDDPSAPAPSWRQPVDDKPKSAAGRFFRKTWLIVVLVLVLIAIAVAVPLALHFSKTSKDGGSGSKSGASNKAVLPDGRHVGSGSIPNFPSAIDPATPKDALTTKSVDDGSDYVLVFSDEFETAGRSFYPGDDPYWEAVDLHYWQTGDLEWYEPGQITTKDGHLEIRLDMFPDSLKTQNYNLTYRSGMMASWNKFCFTGGRIETSVMLPGANNVVGLWPAVWAMGNLGRVGYGASLEGLWPYTYDSCDVGTLANQTLNSSPVAATINGDPQFDGVLSFLPGQRLSACTCPGEVHPGPKHADGSFVGRSAPEIDIIEATIGGGKGIVSQSGQWAPFNAHYDPFNSTDDWVIYNETASFRNAYRGGVFQQAISSLTETNQLCYELSDSPCFDVYGFEYKPGFEGGYITWLAQGVKAWTMKSSATRADPITEIAARPIPQEPMYIITNLGISNGFGKVDVEHLTFPAKMRIDWIRVYQPKGQVNIGCSPKDFPTAEYIEKFPGAYNNPNLTTWEDDFKQKVPKNKLIDQC